MAIERINTTGLRSPDTILKVVEKAMEMKHGDILKVLGDCPELEKELRTYCQGTNQTILSVDIDERGRTVVHIQF